MDRGASEAEGIGDSEMERHIGSCNKNNHSLDLSKLNKDAQDRLSAKYIEAESLFSLRVTGKHRLYGYMADRVFNILWYDTDHGDNGVDLI